MTSEVVLLNKIGIALAADSAVTVGGNAEKIYTSAEKLFQISEFEPVGVMIYGNAAFLGIPWETILKVFRKELGRRSFDTVSEYGEYLLAWLAENYDLFPEDTRKRQVILIIRMYYLFLREKIGEELDLVFRENDCLDEADLPDTLDRIIKAHLEYIRNTLVLEKFENTDKKDIRKTISSSITEVRKNVFGNLPFKPSTKRLLTTMAVEIITRHYFGPLKSGLVVAGFGNKEYMPSLVAYEIEEMFEDKIRLKKIYDDSISDAERAIIVPFAQKDMVYTFMEGIDSQLNTFMVESTAELIVSLRETIINSIMEKDAELGENLQEAIDLNELSSGLFESWERKKQDYWMPIVQVVSSLPKNELAEMAESLVNLTKLRRKVTTVPETVGGPVDVAIITKGDGFIWVRRKHYFESSLNSKFLEQYRQSSHMEKANE